MVSGIQGENIWWDSKPWAKLWHVKYARDKLTCDLVRFNVEKAGSHIWMKAQSNKKLVQDHSFWEIRDGQVMNLWEDSWN